jgi:uncharacterized protein YrrD
MRDIRLESDVRTKDGEKVGTVDQLVVHPDTLEIVSIIVKEGTLFTKDRIIDMEMVDRVDVNGDVVLEISKEHEEELPELATARFIEPDRDQYNRLSEMNYMATPSAAGNVLIFSEPVDSRFAPAPDSPMMPASADPPAIHDETNLPPNTVTIEEGTDVVDRNGEKLGTIDEIIYGDDRTIDAVIVGEGFLFKHHVRIPADWIASAGHEHIILDRTADEAERAGRID